MSDSQPLALAPTVHSSRVALVQRLHHWKGLRRGRCSFAVLECYRASSGEKPAGSRSASLRADYPRLGILHTPPRFIPRCVLVAIPRGPAYVKVGVRRSSKHDPRARISHRSREAAMRRIKRPKHHPVWPYRNWRACLIEGRVVAMLRGPAEHITQSR